MLAVLLALASFTAACGFGGEETTTAAPETEAPDGAGTTEGAAPAGSGEGDCPADASADTITIGVPSLQEQYVDPHFTVGGLLFGMRWAISEGLYRQDLDGQWIPNLATDYEVSEDGLTWTFNLRDDVLMHDGSTFTAQDQKTAIDRVLGSEEFAHLAAFRSLVTGANVIDDTTIEITTSAPYATLISDLIAVPPIPTEYYNTVGEQGFREQPMAAGPFKFVSQELNSSITYERFEDFFDPERMVNFENLVFQIIPDESSRVAGIQTGTLDIAYGLSALAAGQLESAPGVRIVESPGTGQAWVMPLDNIFPDQPSPLHDVRVRQALLMAIDRESIAKSLYQGYAEVPKVVMTPATLGYDDSFEGYEFDPEAAQALLEEAGATDLQLTLNSYATTSTIPHFSRLAETIAGYWNQIGVETTLNVADANTILPAWRARQLRGVGLIAGPVSYYDEPSRFGSSFFASDASYTTLVDAEMDALLDRIDSAVDIEEREQLGHEFGELLHEQLYALPIVRTSSLIALSPDVCRFEYIPGNPYFGPFWYLRAA